MKDKLKIIWNGIVPSNPVLILAIGLCSVVAVTNFVKNALLMSFAFSFVLILSEVIVSSIRKWIPDEIRVPIFVVVIATFTTIAALLSHAYFPSVYDAIKLYILLVVVNCIIIGRAEAFAYKNGVFDSLLDGIGMSLGYSWVIIAIAVIRELFGNGTIANIRVMPHIYQPALIMILPPAGFLVLGVLVGWLEWSLKRKKEAKK